MISWVGHILGNDNVSGPFYAWWSGSGSVIIGELPILGVLLAVLRKHNCEVHRCWRMGRHATAAGHVVCRKHHPEDRLTAEVVRQAHSDALEAPQACTRPGHMCGSPIAGPCNGYPRRGGW